MMSERPINALNQGPFFCFRLSQRQFGGKLHFSSFVFFFFLKNDLLRWLLIFFLPPGSSSAICRPAVNGRKSMPLQLESSGSPTYKRWEAKTCSAELQKTHSIQDSRFLQGSSRPFKASFLSHTASLPKLKSSCNTRAGDESQLERGQEQQTVTRDRRFLCL